MEQPTLDAPKTSDSSKTVDVIPPAEEVIIPPQPSKVDKRTLKKVENPKSEQFTARATKADFDRINAAIEANRANGAFDIVSLSIIMLDYIEEDWFKTFPTK